MDPGKCLCSQTRQFYPAHQAGCRPERKGPCLRALAFVSLLALATLSELKGFSICFLMPIRVKQPVVVHRLQCPEVISTLSMDVDYLFTTETFYFLGNTEDKNAAVEENCSQRAKI